jgi:hypothetical protein
MRTQNTLVHFHYDGLKTTCEILDINGNAKAASTVTRYIKDRPCKVTARTNAFKNVMRKVIRQKILSKEERTEVWNVFRTTLRQPIK